METLLIKQHGGPSLLHTAPITSLTLFFVSIYYSHTPSCSFNRRGPTKHERTPITRQWTSVWKVGHASTCNCTCASCVSIASGICKIYEEHLRQLHPHSASITYDISELFLFIDNLHDLSCLVYVHVFSFTHMPLYTGLLCRHQSTSNMYSPHNKEWLKEKIYGMLKKQAGPSRTRR